MNIMNEKLPITPSNPIRARFYEYPRFTYPWHFHRENEIIYVEQGEGECLVGDSIVSYAAGDVLFFGSELPHSMQTPSACFADKEYRVKGVNIQFEANFMQYAISQYAPFAGIRSLLEGAGRGLRFASGSSVEIVALVKQIPAAQGASQLILLLSLLQQMASCDGKSYLTAFHYSLPPSVMRNERMAKILDYLNNHYTENITLGGMASFIAMNETAFCRYFKENTGKTFKEYIFEMRVGYACKLLNHTAMNISQIGSACGFDSLCHFNRIFKRIVGMSPTAYKTRMK